MPNSTNPRSTSGSPPVGEDTQANANGNNRLEKAQNNENIRILVDEQDAPPTPVPVTPEQEANETAVNMPEPDGKVQEDDIADVLEDVPDEMRERDGDDRTYEEAAQAELAAEGVPMQPPPPPPKPEIEINPEVQQSAKSGRSLRMQIRYTRSLLWAAWLFARVLFWQWVVKPIFGEAFVRRRNVSRWKQYAREFRDFAAGMGGVFIKAGQFISTRADVFPEEIIMELAGLQDEIPAIRFEKIRKVLREELGDDYQQHFHWLREEPIAAASLGQVHRAQLRNGDRVVIKVRRPGITSIVATDMAALKVIAHVAMRFKFISRRANAIEIVEEFGRVLWEEVSYLHEAQNLQRFARMFQDDLGIYVPMVYEEYSTDRVLMMEDVTSIKINDYERLEEAGVKRSEVARRLMNSYLKQVFDEQFFHADPHPGNLFVYPLPVEEGQEYGEEGRPFYLIYVDFGMTGKLTPQIVDGLVSTLVAIVRRDAKQLVKSYQQLDLLLPSADVERLEQATKATFDQVWGMNMADLSNVDYEVMEQLGSEFNDLLFDMPFQMPQNFIYLARTMGILSGMCTSLDPQFNPWQELQPYTEKMMRVRASSGGTVGGELGSSLLQSLFGVSGANNIFEAGSQIITRAVAPTTSGDALAKQLRSGEVRVTSEPSRKWQIELHLLEVHVRTVTRAVIFTGFLISSTLLLTSGWTLVAIGGYVVCVLVGWQILFPPNVIK